MNEAAETIRTRNGEATVRVVSPQLLVTVSRGITDSTMILTYFRIFHAFIDGATHKVDIFHDWYDVTAAEPEARALYTKWVSERKAIHQRICRGAHTLVHSPLIYLALEAGMIGVHYAHAYRVRDTFERAKQDAALRPSRELIVR